MNLCCLCWWIWTCCWHITSVILDSFENLSPKTTSSSPHPLPLSKLLFLFSAGRRLTLAGWVQYSLSLLPMPKSHRGHGLYLGSIPFSTDCQVCGSIRPRMYSLLHQHALLSPRASKCFLSIPCEEGRVLWQCKFPWSSNCYEGFCCCDSAAMFYLPDWKWL